MSNPYTERRFGRLRFVADMVRRDIATVQRVFGHVVPLRAELLFAEDVLEVDCVSAEFERVPLGHIIPEYRAVFNGDHVRFERGGGLTR